MASKYFVLNLLACEEKDYDKFLYGDDHPSGMTEKATLEILKKVLAERGTKNVVLVQMENKEGVFFVFVDVDSAKAQENAPDFKYGSSIVSFHGSQSAAAFIDEDKVEAMAGELLIRADVIGRCFKAFPLIKEELKKNGFQVNDRLFADIADLAKKFSQTGRGGTDDLMIDADMAKVESVEKALDQWNQKLFAAVKAIFSDAPKPVSEDCKKLAADLEVAKNRISQLEKQLQEAADSKKKVDDENASLKASNESLEKEIEELKKKISKPISTSPVIEPTILNTVIEFDPKKFAKDGKEEILFFKMMGYYKYYYIAKDCADELKLDKSKSVKLTIASFESHCHTDEEKESKIAQEYHVPKGEDFFICRGKVFLGKDAP